MEYIEIQNPNEIAQPYEEEEYFRSLYDATLKYNLYPLSDNIHEYFMNDPYEPSNENHHAAVIRNRQVFVRTIFQVAREWNLPIADIQSGEKTDYNIWRDRFQAYDILVKLAPGPWVRENPGLDRFLEEKNGRKEEIYDVFPPMIQFHFQDQEEGTWFHGYTTIQLQNIHPTFLIPLAFVIDFMLFTTYQNLGVEGPPANQLMAETKNISRRRIVSKVLESKVGDPSFAWYMSKFATEIPRRTIHPEIKNIKSSLFQGGKRKTRKVQRKAKRRAATRK